MLCRDFGDIDIELGLIWLGIRDSGSRIIDIKIHTNNYYLIVCGRYISTDLVYRY
jgi:hypothetical protein